MNISLRLTVLLVGIIMGPVMAQSPGVDGIRDPFMPVSHATYRQLLESFESASDDGFGSNQRGLVQLVGIVWDTENPLAILAFQGRKRILSVGEQFRSMEVLKVKETHVLLKRGSKTFILEVGKQLSI